MSQEQGQERRRRNRGRNSRGKRQRAIRLTQPLNESELNLPSADVHNGVAVLGETWEDSDVGRSGNRFDLDDRMGSPHAYWFDDSVDMSPSDEEEYQRMADELASDGSASSLDDYVDSTGSHIVAFKPDRPGVPITRMNKQGEYGEVVTENFSFFSKFESIMPALPANCGRPQEDGHPDSFPFKGQKKQGKSLYTKIIKGRTKKYGSNVYRSNATSHGNYGEYGIKRQYNRYHESRPSSTRGYVIPHGAMVYHRY